MGEVTLVAFGAVTIIGLGMLLLGALRRARRWVVLGAAILLAVAGAWTIGLVGILAGVVVLPFLKPFR